MKKNNDLVFNIKYFENGDCDIYFNNDLYYFNKVLLSNCLMTSLIEFQKEMILDWEADDEE